MTICVGEGGFAVVDYGRNVGDSGLSAFDQRRPKNLRSERRAALDIPGAALNLGKGDRDLHGQRPPFRGEGELAIGQEV